MVRPRKCRLIGLEPCVTYFKPRKVKMVDLEEVEIRLDEFEVIRLTDLECLEQKAVAKKMRISQPTINRTLNSARKKIADALVNGKAIKIYGGKYIIKR